MSPGRLHRGWRGAALRKSTSFPDSVLRLHPTMFACALGTRDASCVHGPTARGPLRRHDRTTGPATPIPRRPGKAYRPARWGRTYAPVIASSGRGGLVVHADTARSVVTRPGGEGLFRATIFFGLQFASPFPPLQARAQDPDAGTPPRYCERKRSTAPAPSAPGCRKRLRLPVLHGLVPVKPLCRAESCCSLRVIACAKVCCCPAGLIHP